MAWDDPEFMVPHIMWIPGLGAMKNIWGRKCQRFTTQPVRLENVRELHYSSHTRVGEGGVPIPLKVKDGRYFICEKMKNTERNKQCFTLHLC